MLHENTSNPDIQWRTQPNQCGHSAPCHSDPATLISARSNAKVVPIIIVSSNSQPIKQTPLSSYQLALPSWGITILNSPQSATALLNTFSMILNRHYINKKNPTIIVWKYWSRELSKAVLFCHQIDTKKQRGSAWIFCQPPLLMCSPVLQTPISKPVPPYSADPYFSTRSGSTNGKQTWCQFPLYCFRINLTDTSSFINLWIC